jgi:hypothetical protein
MAAADRVLELLDSMLSGGKADPAIISGLVGEKVPEGLYVEYKRGRWLDSDRTQDLRTYVSGFANAEGGLLIIGIVGGEDVQGSDKWSIEAPTCPDKAGWTPWLSRVLSVVSAKTRVEWQIVEVDQKDVVVIAANRAQELIRVFEKRNAICYLRIGDSTVPIDETLYADLALGRRAKPDLAMEELDVVGTNDSRGFFLAVSLSVHNQGLLWVPAVSVAWCGYSVLGETASASLKRELALRPPSEGNLEPKVGSLNLWGLSTLLAEVRPFQQARFAAQINGLPVQPGVGAWAWYGAVMVLPQNGSPLWAQLAVHGAGIVAHLGKAWALPPGTAPVVAWFHGDGVPRELKTTFGDAAPK